VITLHTVVVRDALAPLLQQWAGDKTHWAVSVSFVTPLFALLVLLPLSLLSRSVSSLIAPSALALVCVLLLCMTVIYGYASDGCGLLVVLDPQPIEYVVWAPGLLLALAVFVFALTPQLILFPLVAHYESSILGRKNALKLAAMACIVSCALYLIVGLFGYMTLTLGLSSNWLRNLDLSHWPSQAATVAMLLNVSVNFALFSLCGIDALQHLVNGRSSLKRSSFSTESISSTPTINSSKVAGVGVPVVPAVAVVQDETRGAKVRSALWLLLCAVLVIALPTALVVAVESADLLVVASVTGATTSMFVCFILPAVFYIRAWMSPTCCISVRHTVVVYGFGALLILVGVAAGAACSYAVVTRQFYSLP
jgi:amino acid permease